MAMCLRLRPTAPSLHYFPTRFSRTFSPPKHSSLNSLSLKPRFFTKITMSSSSSQTVEHVVLFKVKPDAEPSQIAAMLSGLNGLSSLDSVLHISAGPLLRNRSPAYGFTHLLHSRYASKDDLASYSQHPSHVGVVKESVLPICEDVMAVDWLVDDLGGGAVVPPLGSAMRLSFLKLKENVGAEAKSEILATIQGVKDGLGDISQLSVGENFSPARAKGFSIASLAVFPGTSELEAVESNQDALNTHKDKVRDYLESVIVVDYVVSLPESASL